MRDKDDGDSLWKMALDRWFERFILFYYPSIHGDIDWARPFEFLDKELQKITRGGKLGRRQADKLVKVWLKDGGATWLLIHIEIQGYHEKGFARRAFVYNIRIFNSYNKEVVTLVVLTDASKSWRPRQFSYGRWRSRTSFSFEPVKLLDFAGKEAALEADPNPFAAITLAHLKALETKRDPGARAAWKLRLVRGLYDRGLSAPDVRELFHLIDWMLTLPKPLDDTFWHEVERLEEEKRMPYISSVERLGHEKGLKEGLKEGKEKGRKEGRLLGQIEMLLEQKFGAAGLALMPDVEAIESLKALQRLRKLAETASSADQVRQALPA